MNSHHHPGYKDGAYFKSQLNASANFSSITNVWGKMQKEELLEIRTKLQNMRKSRFAPIKSGLETYFE